MMMMNQNQVEVKASTTVWSPALWGSLGGQAQNHW